MNHQLRPDPQLNQQQQQQAQQTQQAQQQQAPSLADIQQQLHDQQQNRRNLLSRVNNNAPVAAAPLLHGDLALQQLLQQVQANNAINAAVQENLAASLTINPLSNLMAASNWNLNANIFAQAQADQQQQQQQRGLQLPALLQQATQRSTFGSNSIGSNLNQYAALNDARMANLATLLRLQQQAQHPQPQPQRNQLAGLMGSLAAAQAPAAATQLSTTTTSLTPAKRNNEGNTILSVPQASADAESPTANGLTTSPGIKPFAASAPPNGTTNFSAAAEAEAAMKALLAAAGTQQKAANKISSPLTDQRATSLLIESVPARTSPPASREGSPDPKKKYDKMGTISKSPLKKRRVMSAVTTSSVGGGANVIPHHSEREKHPLGVDEDHNWLSEFQCFARAEMMEVFQANKAYVVVRSTSKSVKLNQVGVRCRFCAHVPHADRVNRSSAFPSGLAKIYQSFNMMVRDHFANCMEIPQEIVAEYLGLKGKNSQGACDSRHYWYYAAQKLGMVDTDNGNGIEINAATRAAALQMPPYGTVLPATTAEGNASSDASSSAVAKKGEEEEDLSLIPNPEDLARAPPFLSELLSHLQMVRLLPSERVGKRKTLPIGLEGFGCRYCYKEGRLGFSRCYPLRRRGLSAQIYDMHLHLQRCTVCPKVVKDKLKQLEPPAAAVAAAKKPTKVNSGSNAWYGEDTEFMDMAWARLGRTIDLTT